MKHIITKYWILAIILTAAVSCAKIKHPPGTASLNIVNAVVDSKPLMPVFTNANPLAYFINAERLSYRNFDINNQFTAYSGTQQLVLYQFPDTLKSSQPLHNLTLDLPVGSIRTLFLTGTVNTLDTILTFDAPPYIPAADSATAIRFINLSQGSAPISVNIAGHANGSAVDQLSYKGITGYQNHKIGNALFEGYVFEFRDAASGTLIATYAPKDVVINGAPTALQIWLNRSFTLALVGLPGGTGADAQAILLVPHQFI